MKAYLEPILANACVQVGLDDTPQNRYLILLETIKLDLQAPIAEPNNIQACLDIYHAALELRWTLV